jgi:hypothetical protein
MMQFFNAVDRWKEIEPHLADAEFQRILTEDFSRFTWGRYRQRFPDPNRPLPHDWDGFAGAEAGRYLGPTGEYQKYTLDLCCHWLVGANLRLAQLVLPDRPWRIVCSRQNHTVYDGRDTLFDLEGLSLYGSADLAYEFAFGLFGRELPVGQYLTTKYAEHYILDVERKKRGTPFGRCPFCNELATGYCCTSYAAYVPTQTYRRMT